MQATYRQAVQGLRDGLAEQILELWRGLSSWRAPQIDDFAHAAVPLVLGAQREAARLTAAYLGRYRTVALHGEPERLVSVRAERVTGAAVRKGTDPVEVYRRAGHQVWRQLGEGHSLDDAVESGGKRAVKSAQTDVQLSKRAAAQQALAGDRQAVGWRRVIEGPHSCGLCIVASTQRYHKRELQPIHPGCDCDVLPLYEETEQVIDEETLLAAHQSIQDTFGEHAADARRLDYRDLIVVHEHGELGPVLGVRGQEFTGPSDLKHFTHDRIDRQLAVAGR